MNIGDILWFYATRPVAGVIGIGLVKDKYIDTVNLVVYFINTLTYYMLDKGTILWHGIGRGGYPCREKVHLK
jgi:hypothetical protein